MRFRVDFQADPEAKEKLIHHFESLRGVMVIPTHDGAHMDVADDHQYATLIIDVYNAAEWPGVRATKIALENGE